MSNGNNSNKNVTLSIGGGFTGLLTIVFIVLKIIGQIDWGWIWVLSPLWIPWAVVVAIFLVSILIGLIAMIVLKIRGDT